MRLTAIAFLGFGLALSTFVISAQGQTLGVYADAGGLVNSLQPTQGEAFDYYVVLFAEDTAAAASFSLDVPDLDVDLFLQGVSYGPSGNGLNIITAGGNNVGFGECAIGFGGMPVVVARYTAILPFESMNARIIQVGPNPEQDPNLPVYVTCNDVLKTAAIGPPLTIDAPVATDSQSFGAIKSLYSH